MHPQLRKLWVFVISFAGNFNLYALHFYYSLFCLGVAGGLTKLSKMPACNVLVLGSQKATLSGFSQVATLPHTGFIYYSDIVQETPPVSCKYKKIYILHVPPLQYLFYYCCSFLFQDLRRKAARLVAAKSMLAARVDACHESTDGRIGQTFREEIEKKLDKLQEPPPVKFVKPLPKPIDPGRKKRGGKRVRKMKERYAITEFRKHANRMNFADVSFRVLLLVVLTILIHLINNSFNAFLLCIFLQIENDAYQEDLGYSRGIIGKAGTGRIRLPQIDEKTKVRISKTLQKNLQKQQQWGGSTTVKKQVSGTASSVAFTPLQVCHSEYIIFSLFYFITR